MQILPIGGYFPKDNEGFLINPAKWELVPNSFQQFIRKLIEKIPAEEKSQIDSIYLRGSLPRGMDEKYISDIDLFALTSKKGMRWQSEEWAQQLILSIKKEEKVSLEVELTTTTYDEDLLANYPLLAAIIKTQAICIYGSDFSKKLPRFKPGKSLLLNYRWLINDLKNAQSENATLSDQKHALKTLIRTGFEIVMEREKAYTPDLYWCVQSFGKWYPDLEDQMTRTLQIYLNSSPSKQDLKVILNDLGSFIVKESLKYLP